jgi:hypothetical protein
VPPNMRHRRFTTKHLRFCSGGGARPNLFMTIRGDFSPKSTTAIYTATDGQQVGVVREFVVCDLGGRRLAHVDQFSEFYKEPLPPEFVHVLDGAVPADSRRSAHPEWSPRMTTAFRRLSFLVDANPDDIVVHIARAGGSPKARVMMPCSPVRRAKP